MLSFLLSNLHFQRAGVVKDTLIDALREYHNQKRLFFFYIDNLNVLASLTALEYGLT